MLIESLENGFALKSVESAEDIERYVRFNARFNNEHEGNACRLLLNNRPGVRRQDFLYVEERGTGGIVSTTCLIPWELSYQDVALRAAMIEMVLSHPDYRKQGLIRLQIARLTEMIREQGYDLSVIWGVPYYYRQFGYAYCLDGNRSEELASNQIPDAVGSPDLYTFRKASQADIPQLMTLYEEAHAGFGLAVLRGEAEWRYLLDDVRFPLWIAQGRDGLPCAYFAFGSDGPVASLPEHAVRNAQAGLSILQWSRAEAETLMIGWPKSSVLSQLARSLGSVASEPAQWLIRIVDLPEFLGKLAPVFEKRLADSNNSKMTRTIVINLFRQAYELRFTAGRLSGAVCVGFRDSSMGADGGDLCIPPDAFTRLVLGYRTIDELRDAWPDIVVKPESRCCLETLFPKMDSYLDLRYQY